MLAPVGNTGEIQRLISRDDDVLRSAWLEFAAATSPLNIHQLKTGGCLYRLFAVFRVSYYLFFAHPIHTMTVT